jgi:tetratricopeptide (TPR) repeat protein
MKRAFAIVILIQLCISSVVSGSNIDTSNDELLDKDRAEVKLMLENDINSADLVSRYFLEGIKKAQNNQLDEARQHFKNLINLSYYVQRSRIILCLLEEYEDDLLNESEFNDLLDAMVQIEKYEGLNSARSKIENVIKTNKKIVSAYNLLSWIAFDMESYVDAEKYAKDAIAQDSDNPNSYMSLANACNIINDLPNEEINLKKVIELDPYRYEAYIYLAGLYCDQGEFIKAKNVLDKAKDSDRAYFSSYQLAKLDFFYSDLVDYSIVYYFGIALENGKKGNFEKAKNYFASVLIFDEYDIDAISSLIMLEDLENGKVSEEYSENIFKGLQHWDNPKKAIPYFKKAIKLNQLYPRAYNCLGVMYKKGGNYDKGIEYYTKAIEVNNDYYIAYYNRALAYDEQKKYDEAIKDYNEAIKIYPQYMSAYRNLGIIYKDLGDYDKAIECFKEAVKIKPEYSRNYYSISICLYMQGKYEQAIEQVDLALKYCPSYFRSYQQLGVCYKALGRNAKAIEAFKMSIWIDPNDEFAYRKLGQVYYDLGFYKESIVALEKAIELTEDNYWNYLYLGYDYSKLEKYQEAIAYFKEALEERFDSAKANYQIGRIYYCYLNKPAEAILYLEKLVKKDKTYAPGFYYLGCSYFKIKSYSLSKKNLENAKKIYQEQNNSEMILEIDHILEEIPN